MRFRKNGFTLIELLVVIAVVATAWLDDYVATGPVDL